MRRSSIAQRRAPQPTAAYLDETLAALWPGSGRSRRGARCGSVPAGATELVVLPDARRPRLVVPRRPLAATAAAVLGSRSTSSLTTAVALRALAAAARLGAADLLPDRIVVDPSGACDIVGHLSEQLGHEVLVSLLIGPVRATQKPVLQVLRPTGATVGFAKIGLTPISRELVRREGEVLAELAGRGLRVVRAPRVLHRGRWQGAEVLVQEAFPQHRGAPVDQDRLTAAMVELARSHGVERAPLAETALWHRLRDRLRDRADRGPAGAALADAVRRTEAARGAQQLPMGCWHGDWAPWNMTTAAGEMLVWDWETFAAGIPLGFDRVHYGLQSAVVLDGVPAAAAVAQAADRAGTELAAFDVPADSRRLVVLIYLLHLVAGFLETGERNSRLARLDSWAPAALPALADQVVADAPAADSERIP
jgi:hypothetical protein